MTYSMYSTCDVSSGKQMALKDLPKSVKAIVIKLLNRAKKDKRTTHRERIEGGGELYATYYGIKDDKNRDVYRYGCFTEDYALIIETDHARAAKQPTGSVFRFTGFAPEGGF